MKLNTEEQKTYDKVIEYGDVKYAFEIGLAIGRVQVSQEHLEYIKKTSSL